MAIDSIDVNSKLSIEIQMINELGLTSPAVFKDKFKKELLVKKNNLVHKALFEGESIDLDQQMDEVGFTDLQKEYISKITSLYPLDNGDLNGNENLDGIVVVGIKSGLVNFRNEVNDDYRLIEIQKRQLFDYIDVQYATLESIINFVERSTLVQGNNGKFINNFAGKWKISLRKIINIVVSIVVTVAILTVTAALLGDPAGGGTGAVIGFIGSVISAASNKCIKYCGTGYCDTAWDNCYTGAYESTLPKFTN